MASAFYYVVLLMKNMKKTILTFLMSLMFLCTGCSKQIPTNEKSDEPGFLFNQQVIEYIDANYDHKVSYYYGTGIKALAVEDDHIVNGKTEIIPIYREDEPIFFIIYGSEAKMIKADKVSDYIRHNHKYIVIEAENELCLISADGVITFDDDVSYLLDEKISSLIKKEIGNRFQDNIMGSGKSIIKMVNPKDPDIKENADSANDHIIVKFKDGDRTEQIAKYEEFCKGKAQSGSNTSDIYIFYFDALSSEELNKLLEESNKLNYVEIAQLDKQNELIDPVKVTD